MPIAVQVAGRFRSVLGQVVKIHLIAFERLVAKKSPPALPPEAACAPSQPETLAGAGILLPDLELIGLQLQAIF